MIDDENHESSTMPPTVESTPVWAVLTVAVLAGVAVWSPQTGSGLGVAFVAGACTTGIIGVSMSLPERAPTRRLRPLVVIAAGLLIALFGCAVVGTVSAMSWLPWAAAITATLIVAGVLFAENVPGRRVSASRSSGPTRGT